MSPVHGGLSHLTAAAIVGAAIAGVGLLGGCLLVGAPTDPNAAKDANDPVAAALRVADDDHVLGSADAPLTVIEYGDFQCPVCRQFEEETFPAIKSEYIDAGKVRWVYRHYPLRTVHPQAESAARASECAAADGRFWSYHAALFANQTALLADDLRAYAAGLGIDGQSFAACQESEAVAARVQRDVDSGRLLGVTGTPTFYVRGERVAGFRSAAQFRELLDAALTAR
ncbi:MAG: DsbA family protein [Phycisphaerae bacterium]|jgi:protein-disulfide isomerase|nr:DsbA family protein [Phycisphaerae bacterium]MCZ2398755.1 DsbA family protein [Phycisphaerae bacterium]